MGKISLIGKLSLLALTVSFISCDKDFNTIGSDIVGEDYFDLNKHTFYGLQTGSELTGAVQTNNLPVNSFGVYNNPVFGKTTSHFVTQVELIGAAPDFGDNPQVDSAWVYIPYFNHADGMEDDNIRRKYVLDSVYGRETKFKLKVYENGYYMGNNDPGEADGILKHYSNEKDLKIEPYKRGFDDSGQSVVNGSPLNDGPVSENDEFFFDKSEKIIYKTNQAGQFLDASNVVTTDPEKKVIKDRFAPGMWINLNKEFIKNRILKAPDADLLNNNVFKEYFRGLYFKAEANADDKGAMAMLDFSKGYIQIEYSYEATSGTPPVTTTKRSSVKLNLKGNTANFYDNNYNMSVGPNRLLLTGGGKGTTGSGEGSFAYIDLFGPDADNDGTPDELEYIKSQGWLINEANLVFYVDQSVMGIDEVNPDTENPRPFEPKRIYLYDSKNNKPIADYALDPTISPLGSKFNKYFYGGILEKDAAKKGVKYKFRITEYLKACIKKDSTNFRLRLAVTENIGNATNVYLKSPVGTPQVKMLPTSSVVSPLGTVLHNQNSEDPEKRLKLEIYYTKPD
ncbi:DUF4270 domain-containing protein [Flavobacterium pedocola]